MESRGNYLIELGKKYRWTRGAELGVWYGETFFRLLDGLPDLFLIGVDDWRDNPRNVHHKDQNENRESVYSKQRNYPGRSWILQTTTVRAALLVPDESLDFVFIDADHRYQAVKDDISAWTPKVKPGGFVTGHDFDIPDVRKAVTELLGETECAEYSDYTWAWRKTDEA